MARKQDGGASDNILRKEYAQHTRLQRAVNADVASSHANPVAETVHNAKATRGDRTVSGKCRHRHQGDGSGRSTVEGRAAKRARREGPGPVSTPLVNDSNTLHLVLRLDQRRVYQVRRSR